MPVDLERATSRIWSYALQAERKAVMYEVVIGACLVFEKLVENGRFGVEFRYESRRKRKFI